MTFRFRSTLVRGLLPENFAVFLVEAIDLPGVLRCIGGGLHIAEEAVPEARLRVAADGSRDEDFVGPDNRAGDGDTWNWSLPAHINRFFDIETHGRLGGLSDAGSVRSAELRPVLGRERSSENECGRDASHYFASNLS